MGSLTIFAPLLYIEISAGSGIGIRINDDGVDPNHPDFRSKFDAESSCQVYTPVELNKKYSHGTTCAALAAASADGSCSVGMAPGATISACRVISVETTPEVADDSYLYANMEKMHISSNSFGYPNCKQRETFGERRLQSCPFSSTSPNSPCVVNACSGVDWSNPILRDSCELAIARYCQLETQSDVQACTSLLNLYTKCYFGSQSKQQVDAYIKGITEGRDGKGIIYVNSAGNDFGFGAQANFAGNLNSRFVISVGAVGKDGVHSTFSQGGSALLVSAPGGDFDFYTNNLVAMAGGGCTEGGSGTSNACPVVSGILALVLQANNNLSWRDVQGIIASTSQQVKPDDPSWTTNSAGFHHSYVYGFGIVDATAAVNAARTWANFNSETEIIGKSGALNLTIPEFTGGAVVSSINISSSSTFVAESVIVSLDVAHSSRGHLEISLVSPQGTASILSPGGRPESAQLSEPWVIKTVRNWGESANGEWSLRLEDRSEGDSSTCVDVADWTLNLGNDTHPVEFGCFELAFTKVCADGALTRTFGAIFPGLDATDPIFTDVNNVSLFSACCVCGGGQPASPVADMLKSWQLAVYGHDGISVPASPGLEAPIVATNASVPTAGTTNDGFNSTVSPTEAPTGAAVNDDESSMTGTPTMAPSSLPSATEVSAGNGTDPTGFATNGSGPSVGSSNAPTGSLSPPDLSPGPPAPVGGTTSSVSSQSGGGWINSAGAWYFFVLAVIMF